MKSMFRSRLKETFRNLLVFVAIAIVVIALSVGITYLLTFPAVRVVGDAILVCIMAGLAFVVLLVALWNVARFINWLFIEPFRKHNRKHKHK